MTRDVTSIEIKNSTWSELNQLKRGPGDSFDDVIQRLLQRPEEPIEPEPEPEEEADEEPVDDALTCPDCDKHFDSFEDLRGHMDANPDPDH